MKLSEIKSDAGFMALGLRLVVGWTYFSAFFRRTILTNKLDPELPGYIGEKFNHFLPNALGIQPVIEYLVEHPDLLWLNMLMFTIVEGIVGFLIMFGFFTRLMSIGVFLLAMGILLGSGWIGTTCLDEWQIGVLGISAGFLLFLTGGGAYSIDRYFIKNNYSFASRKWFNWLGSGELPLSNQSFPKLVLLGSFFLLGMTLMTNQVFHGGLWGPLHNKSVKPKLEITDTFLENGILSFDVFRTEGVDVYGAWIIKIELLDENGDSVFKLNQNDLAHLDDSAISNYYVAKVQPGIHSLVVPLGAKAKLELKVPQFLSLKQKDLKLEITDISGASWVAEVMIIP